MKYKYYYNRTRLRLSKRGQTRQIESNKQEPCRLHKNYTTYINTTETFISYCELPFFLDIWGFFGSPSGKSAQRTPGYRRHHRNAVEEMPRIHHQRGDTHRQQGCPAHQKSDRRVLHRAGVDQKTHRKGEQDPVTAGLQNDPEAKAQHQIPRHHGKRGKKSRSKYCFHTLPLAKISVFSIIAHPWKKFPHSSSAKPFLHRSAKASTGRIQSTEKYPLSGMDFEKNGRSRRKFLRNFNFLLFLAKNRPTDRRSVLIGVLLISRKPSRILRGRQRSRRGWPQQSYRCCRSRSR